MPERTYPSYTQGKLDAMPIPKGQAQLKRTLAPNLFWVKGPKKQTFYFESTKVNGGKPVNLGSWPQMTYEQAMVKAREWRGDLEMRRRPKLPTQSGMTVMQAYHKWFDDRDDITPETRTRLFPNALRRTGLADRVIRDLTEQDIEDAIRAAKHQPGRRKGTTRNTVRSDFQFLARLLALVSHKDGTPNPAAFLAYKDILNSLIAKPERRRVRLVGVDGLAHAVAIAILYGREKGLHRAARQVVSDHFVFCAMTGLRAWQEAGQIKCSEVDQDGGFIRIPRKRLKAKDPQHDLRVPLTPKLRPLVERRLRAAWHYKDARSQYLFPGRRNGHTPHIMTASHATLLGQVRAAGLTAVTHSLRAANAELVRSVGTPDHLRRYLQDWDQPHMAESVYATQMCEEARPWADKAQRELRTHVARHLRKIRADAARGK